MLPTPAMAVAVVTAIDVVFLSVPRTPGMVREDMARVCAGRVPSREAMMVSESRRDGVHQPGQGTQGGLERPGRRVAGGSSSALDRSTRWECDHQASTDEERPRHVIGCTRASCSPALGVIRCSRGRVAPRSRDGHRLGRHRARLRRRVRRESGRRVHREPAERPEAGGHDRSRDRHRTDGSPVEVDGGAPAVCAVRPDRRVAAPRWMRTTPRRRNAASGITVARNTASHSRDQSRSIMHASPQWLAATARSLCSRRFVADAVDRLDEIGPAELAAQLGDVDVHRPRPVGVVEVPGVFQQFVTGEDHAGVREQVHQQVELLRVSLTCRPPTTTLRARRSTSTSPMRMVATSASAQTRRRTALTRAMSSRGENGFAT